MRPIPEFHDVTRARFEREIVAAGEPAVLRGLVAGWPLVAAAKAGDEALADTLRAAASAEPFQAWFGGAEIAGRFAYNADFSGFNHERRLATIDQLLDLLLRQRGQSPAYSMYAGGIPVRKHLPGLLPEIAMPLLDMGREMLISLWLGNPTRTAAHWDLPQNLACVVAGRRRFTVFPTDQIANLYVGPLDFTLAGQPISLVDVDAPDLALYPRFADAMAAAQSAELGPGDALYLPSMWWHAVAALDEIGAMINFWWSDATAPLLTPLNALYHAIVTLKNLPAREQQAWRVMFDHYVFDDAGEAAAHLPDSARGILGRRTPELVARVKKLLADALGR
ncbi:MAG: cupin-like domain-containing protein [Sphingomicrobium sp.]